MRFYTTTHQHYCGIDLHAKQMYVCILNQAGEVLLHANMKASPDPLAVAIAPFREELAISVERLCTSVKTTCSRRLPRRVM